MGVEDVEEGIALGHGVPHDLQNFGITFLNSARLHHGTDLYGSRPRRYGIQHKMEPAAHNSSVVTFASDGSRIALRPE